MLDDGMFVLGLVLVGVVVVVVLVVQYRLEVYRRRRLEWWAIENGWRYQPTFYEPWMWRLPGRWGRCTAALSTHLQGRWVTVADYEYSTQAPGNGWRPATNPWWPQTTHRTRVHYIVTRVRLGTAHPLPSGVGRRGGFSSSEQQVPGDLPIWVIDGSNLISWARTATGLRDPAVAPWQARRLLHVADLLEPPPTYPLSQIHKEKSDQDDR